MNKTKSQKDNNSDKKPTVEGEEQEEDYNQEEFDKEDDIQDNENEKPNLEENENEDGEREKQEENENFFAVEAQDEQGDQAINLPTKKKASDKQNKSNIDGKEESQDHHNEGLDTLANSDKNNIAKRSIHLTKKLEQEFEKRKKDKEERQKIIDAKKKALEEKKKKEEEVELNKFLFDYD